MGIRFSFNGSGMSCGIAMGLSELFGVAVSCDGSVRGGVGEAGVTRAGGRGGDCDCGSGVPVDEGGCE